MFTEVNCIHGTSTQSNQSIPKIDTSKKSVTVSIGYGASTSRPLSEILNYQIQSMQSSDGLTTSSLKVIKDDENVIATKLYSDICYEYDIVDESHSLYI